MLSEIKRLKQKLSDREDNTDIHDELQDLRATNELNNERISNYASQIEILSQIAENPEGKLSKRSRLKMIRSNTKAMVSSIR